MFNGRIDRIRLVRSTQMNIGVCRRCGHHFVRPFGTNPLIDHTCRSCMQLRFEAIMERARRNQ